MAPLHEASRDQSQVDQEIWAGLLRLAYIRTDRCVKAAVSIGALGPSRSSGIEPGR